MKTFKSFDEEMEYQLVQTIKKLLAKEELAKQMSESLVTEVAYEQGPHIPTSRDKVRKAARSWVSIKGLDTTIPAPHVLHGHIQMVIKFIFINNNLGQST